MNLIINFLNAYLFKFLKSYLMESKLLEDLSNFTLIRKVDSGGFGSVYLIRDKTTNEEYAAKVINTTTSDFTNIQKALDREIGTMMHIDHPNIVKFYGYCLKDFEGFENITIIMNYAKNGSLLKILNDVKRGLAVPMYNNTMRQKILIGVSRGMMYLHENHIMHRDIKPGNIIFDENFNALIADFGLSKIYDPSKSTDQTISCGTSVYMAPELITGEIKYDEKVDVYSFSILMYEIITDLIPYPKFQKGKMTLFNFNSKVLHENYRPEFKVPVKESLKQLIINCWSNNPTERLTFEEIFNLIAFNRDFYLENVDEDEINFYVDDIIAKEKGSTKLPNVDPKPQKDEIKDENVKPPQEESRKKIDEKNTNDERLSIFKSKRKKRTSREKP